MACKKCKKMCGGLLLLVGILFLGQDLNWWSFWTLNWWTVAFLILGLGKIGCSCCKECQVSDSKKK